MGPSWWDHAALVCCGYFILSYETWFSFINTRHSYRRGGVSPERGRWPLSGADPPRVGTPWSTVCPGGSDGTQTCNGALVHQSLPEAAHIEEEKEIVNNMEAAGTSLKAAEVLVRDTTKLEDLIEQKELSQVCKFCQRVLGEFIVVVQLDVSCSWPKTFWPNYVDLVLLCIIDGDSRTIFKPLKNSNVQTKNDKFHKIRGTNMFSRSASCSFCSPMKFHTGR